MVSDAYALIKLGNGVFLYKEQRFYNLQFITVEYGQTPRSGDLSFHPNIGQVLLFYVVINKEKLNP